jgi:type I restriction enzyme, S subunit
MVPDVMGKLEEYKISDLGLIPTEWEVKPLGLITEIIMGQSPKSSSYNQKGEGLPFYQGKSEFGSIYPQVKKWCSEPSKIAEANDVLFSVRAPVGEVNMCQEQSCIGRGLGAVRALQNKTNHWFIYYVLSNAKERFAALSQGSTFTAINGGELRNFKVVIPPLKEQQRIAEILLTVDEQLKTTNQLIEKTKSLKNGMMQHLLNKGLKHSEFKQTELGKIPAEWEVKSLGSITEIIMGQSPKSSSYNEKGEGLPFYQGKSEFGSIYPQVKKWCSEPSKIAEANDVLFSVRAPVGEVNMCQEQSCIGRGLGAVRALQNKTNHWFLYYVLSNAKERFAALSQGSTFTAINGGELRNFKVLLPPLQEQQIIAQILFTIDSQIESYKHEISIYEQLKKGLMQELFTGSIRVKA